MADEIDVKILSWPDQPAQVGHQFPTPADVMISSLPAMSVGMDMRMSAPEGVPVCIKLCEPICVRSQYTIGIDVFDRPVASITLRGDTILSNCRDEQG